jgi:hypothetical protein
VVFRDQQDFIDRDVEYYRAWGRHFGRLHIHPTSGHPVNLKLFFPLEASVTDASFRKALPKFT